MPKQPTPRRGKTVESLRHARADATRVNIPTAEYGSTIAPGAADPLRVAYDRRNRDLDPQLVWRGKDQQDWSDLVVQAPPLYIQEKVHPKALIDDLLRRTRERRYEAGEDTPDLFADFDGIPEGADKTDFYRHDQNWSNRMILGDSLQVMASLAEREGLRGQVQCVYVDPPYGIKFNSNFQWSTTSRDVRDGHAGHATREPEQVKAFRDTWRDGVHSYLTYLRDRLVVARELLADSGSIFVQIGDDNVHRLRSLVDEVFGEENFIGLIWFRKKTMPLGAAFLERMGDYIVWSAKDRSRAKFRRLFRPLDIAADFHWNWRETGVAERRRLTRDELGRAPAGEPLRLVSMWPPTFSDKDAYDVPLRGKLWPPAPGQCYPSGPERMRRVARADRLEVEGSFLRYVLKLSDDNTTKLNLTWTDTVGARDQRYVVETSELVIQRCLLLTTDPGDLVLDPTCGSGTTAAVAEHWGRRWITIDTSRVALALARARLMGARYPYYLLADSREGQQKLAEIAGRAPSPQPVYGRLRQGFVYERVPHVTLKSIANNAEIDVIWEEWQAALEPLRERLNAAAGARWQEWEIPREADPRWPAAARAAHAEWWQGRVGRQRAIDASIAARAEFEYLYDRPSQDPRKVRVAGPFTVESSSPHRALGVDERGEPIEPRAAREGTPSFADMILDHLRTTGVQQAEKAGRIAFTALTPWPGDLVVAEGRYVEGEAAEAAERRAAIFVGPEFGTVTRPDLVAAAREAGDAGFDVLVACAFSYDAHATELGALGPVPVLRARMSADLHMAGDLKNTGKGNLFVVFGEPDIAIEPAGGGRVRIKIRGVDVFDPGSGEVRSDGPDGIACWLIDTDYDEQSFFVRHAYFLGANDPYGALKATLRSEIDEAAWSALRSDTSRPFEPPASGRIAVKVINHLGDEVMKVFRVPRGIA